MRTVFLLLCLLIAYPVFAVHSDTSQQKRTMYHPVEVYTSGMIYFTDSAGNTETAFRIEVTVKLFERQNYIHLITGISQGVYPITGYEENYSNGRVSREFRVDDVNVRFIVLDATEMNIYFVRHDGQMMIIPGCLKAH